VDADTVDRFIGRLYTAFILRDATFLISGATVIAVALPQPVSALSKVLGTETSHSWLAVAAFLGLSYVSGVLLQEGARWPLDKASHRYITWRNKKDPSSDRTIVRMQRVHKSGAIEHTIHAIERLIFLRQVAATVLSALVVTTAILLIGSSAAAREWQFWLGAVTALVLCVGTYLDKSRQLEDVFGQLIAERPTAEGSSELAA